MSINDTIKKMRICVIIPTYNNANTLKSVIDGCLKWTSSIIVVNDGSTDHTLSILSEYSDKLSIISYTRNKGKGYALKKGFKYARSFGFNYAITIDSDGQHYPSDIPLFVEAISKKPNSLIVGSRNIAAKNMPSGNTFANKFSNFWFRIQTLQSLPDTQTGYRLYPLNNIGSLWWLTSRYEAELELLVFAAWHGVKLIPIPIQVYYFPKSQRVSHFRPGIDFLRISILNTILCMLAIVYGAPRMFLSELRKIIGL